MPCSPWSPKPLVLSALAWMLVVISTPMTSSNMVATNPPWAIFGNPFKPSPSSRMVLTSSYTMAVSASRWPTGHWSVGRSVRHARTVRSVPSVSAKKLSSDEALGTREAVFVGVHCGEAMRVWHQGVRERRAMAASPMVRYRLVRGGALVAGVLPVTEETC